MREHLSRTDQRLAARALLRGHRISVVNGTLIINRFNRELYERVKRAKTEEANENHTNQSSC